MLTQYVYTPYGELLHLDLPVPADAVPEDAPYMNRVGFQGLFYENFFSDDTQASMIVEGRGLYHARNRWYEPRTGTWTTADPYMTGLTIPTGAGYHGSEPSVVVDSLPGGFADGANQYLAFGGNPLNFLDAMGLYDDSDYDAAAAEYAYGVIGVSGRLAEARYDLAKGAKQAAIYAAAAFLWDGLIMDLGEAALLGLVTGGFGSRICFDGATLVSLANDDQAAIRDLCVGDLVLTLPPASECLRGNEGITADRDSDGRTLADQLFEIQLESLPGSQFGRVTLLRSSDWVEAKGVSCGSIIVAPFGDEQDAPLRVTEVRATPLSGDDLDLGRVTGRFESLSDLIVELQLEGAESPILATPGHLFHSADRCNWVPVKDLREGELISTLRGLSAVESISPRAGRHVVFNIEVHGSHTYHVSEVQALAHNLCYKENGIKSYRALRRQVKGSGLQVHHLIEKRFANLMGQKEGDMLSIAISKLEHQALTILWRNKISYGAGTRAATRARIEQVAKEIYAGYPEILGKLGL